MPRRRRKKKKQCSQDPSSNGLSIHRDGKTPSLLSLASPPSAAAGAAGGGGGSKGDRAYDTAGMLRLARKKSLEQREAAARKRAEALFLQLENSVGSSNNEDSRSQSVSDDVRMQMDASARASVSLEKESLDELLRLAAQECMVHAEPDPESDRWSCDRCTFSNDAEDGECQLCGMVRPLTPYGSVWRCEACTFENMERSQPVFCQVCGTIRNLDSYRKQVERAKSKLETMGSLPSLLEKWSDATKKRMDSNNEEHHGGGNTHHDTDKNDDMNLGDDEKDKGDKSLHDDQEERGSANLHHVGRKGKDARGKDEEHHDDKKKHHDDDDDYDDENNLDDLKKKNIDETDSHDVMKKHIDKDNHDVEEAKKKTVMDENGHDVKKKPIDENNVVSRHEDEVAVVHHHDDDDVPPTTLMDQSDDVDDVPAPTDEHGAASPPSPTEAHISSVQSTMAKTSPIASSSSPSASTMSYGSDKATMRLERSHQLLSLHGGVMEGPQLAALLIQEGLLEKKQLKEWVRAEPSLRWEQWPNGRVLVHHQRSDVQSAGSATHLARKGQAHPSMSTSKFYDGGGKNEYTNGTTIGRKDHRFVVDHRYDPRKDRHRYDPRKDHRYDGRKEHRFVVDQRYDSRRDHRYDGRVDHRYDGRVDHRYDGRVDHRYDGRVDHRYNGRKDPRYDGRVDPRYDGRMDHRHDARKDHRHPHHHDASTRRGESHSYGREDHLHDGKRERNVARADHRPGRHPQRNDARPNVPAPAVAETQHVKQHRSPPRMLGRDEYVGYPEDDECISESYYDDDDDDGPSDSLPTDGSSLWDLPDGAVASDLSSYGGSLLWEMEDDEFGYGEDGNDPEEVLRHPAAKSPQMRTTSSHSTSARLKAPPGLSRSPPGLSRSPPGLSRSPPGLSPRSTTATTRPPGLKPPPGLDPLPHSSTSYSASSTAASNASSSQPPPGLDPPGAFSDIVQSVWNTSLGLPLPPSSDIGSRHLFSASSGTIGDAMDGASPPTTVSSALSAMIGSATNRISKSRIQSLIGWDDEEESSDADGASFSHFSEPPETLSRLSEPPKTRSHFSEPPETQSHFSEPPETQSHHSKSPETQSHHSKSPETQSHHSKSPETQSHFSKKSPKTRSHFSESPEARTSMWASVPARFQGKRRMNGLPKDNTAGRRLASSSSSSSSGALSSPTSFKAPRDERRMVGDPKPPTVSARDEPSRNPHYRTRPCRFFRPHTQSGCKQGDACPFIHPPRPTSHHHDQVEDNKPLKLCRFYRTPRGCRLGDRCPFLHK